MPCASIHCRFPVLVAAAVIAGCVVLPTDVYVPEAGQGALIYESCSLTPEFPAGIELRYAGLRAIVSIARRQAVNLVQVQFDVPQGSTLVLREHVIGAADTSANAVRWATIPHINPAAPARYPETPAMEKLVLPVDTPLRGGRVATGSRSFDRHYWIAAPFEGELGREVSISLPEFSFDGATVRFPDIRFTHQFAIGEAFLNC